VRGNIVIDSDTLLMTDFVNLKIKSPQSFKYTYMSRIYVCVFIRVVI
jgi:hypothetical protein